MTQQQAAWKSDWLYSKIRESGLPGHQGSYQISFCKMISHRFVLLCTCFPKLFLTVVFANSQVHCSVFVSLQQATMGLAFLCCTQVLRSRAHRVGLEVPSMTWHLGCRVPHVCLLASRVVCLTLPIRTLQQHPAALNFYGRLLMHYTPQTLRCTHYVNVVTKDAGSGGLKLLKGWQSWAKPVYRPLWYTKST
jgi:hypothetical protein